MIADIQAGETGVDQEQQHEMAQDLKRADLQTQGSGALVLGGDGFLHILGGILRR